MNKCMSRLICTGGEIFKGVFEIKACKTLNKICFGLKHSFCTIIKTLNVERHLGHSCDSLHGRCFNCLDTRRVQKSNKYSANTFKSQ